MSKEKLCNTFRKPGELLLKTTSKKGGGGVAQDTILTIPWNFEMFFL